MDIINEIIRTGDAFLFIVVFLLLISILTAIVYFGWDARRSNRFYKMQMAKNREAINKLVNKL